MYERARAEDGGSRESILLALETPVQRVDKRWDERGLTATALNLMTLYDSISANHDEARRAVDLIAELAACHVCVEDLVIANARAWAAAQHIDDAFPYEPNSFSVLARLRGSEKVAEFLKTVARDDYGVPQYEARRALAFA